MFRKSPVDSILDDIQEKVALLDSAREKEERKQQKAVEKVNQLREEADQHKAEADRAMRVRAKLADLVA